MENNLTIIPVLNKIDLPAAQPEKFAEELAKLIGCQPEDCLRVSGKTGAGVEELLDQIVKQIPAPVGDPDAPARALIFDSVYDSRPALLLMFALSMAISQRAIRSKCSPLAFATRCSKSA
jgi:translation elongation factor EF-4